MTLSKVVRKGSYQGVTQWGISTSSEITPSRKTARKWAELENARKQAKPITYAQILDRDVPAIVEYVKNWARQGVNGPIEIFYQHEVICGAFTALIHDPTDEGWKPANVTIPASLPYSAYYNFLYQRLGNVPLFA